MLKSLTLTNWKSFGAERNRLELSPLTLLVGPNASGKSNALDALRFLQGAALDYPLGDVLRGRWEGQREIWPAIRGQVIEAARGNQSEFEMESVWDFPGRGGVTHAIAVDTQADALLLHERVDAGNSQSEFDTHAKSLGGASGLQAGGAIKVALRAKGSGKSVARTYSAARSLLGQVSDGDRVDPSVVETAPALDGISFDVTKLREVMFFLDEGATKVSARSVSDGTLRFLGLVTALLTAPVGSLIVLEEPDVGPWPTLSRSVATAAGPLSASALASWSISRPCVTVSSSIISCRRAGARGRCEGPHYS
jgi:hypothetical protein